MILFFDLFPKEVNRRKAISEIEMRYKLAKLEYDHSHHYRDGSRIVMR